MEKNNRILYIKRYLEAQTDEEHQATLADILEHLNGLSIESNRRTVMQDISRLIGAGLDIVITRSTQNRYFMGARYFELPELKLLIDAVQASRFIPQKKGETLIAKLTGFAGHRQAKELRRHLYIDRQARSGNAQAYIAVDLLHTAINAKKQIHFKYYEYTPEKKKVYKHGGRVYEFSPYGLIWNGDYYYAVGHSKHHGKVITFRVDRIAAPRLTEMPCVPKPEGFDMAFYARSVFQMYDGSMRQVTLLCPNRHMKTVVDRFGEDVQTAVMDENHFTATVDVAVSPTFFGWVFANRMRILAPKDVADKYDSLISDS